MDHDSSDFVKGAKQDTIYGFVCTSPSVWLILNEFENLNSNDIIAMNARYNAIVDLTDTTPPSIDISSDDEWTPQLIVGLTTFQWIVDLSTINDGDDEA